MIESQTPSSKRLWGRYSASSGEKGKSYFKSELLKKIIWSVYMEGNFHASEDSFDLSGVRSTCFFAIFWYPEYAQRNPQVYGIGHQIPDLCKCSIGWANGWLHPVSIINYHIPHYIAPGRYALKNAKIMASKGPGHVYWFLSVDPSDFPEATNASVW